MDADCWCKHPCLRRTSYSAVVKSKHEYVDALGAGAGNAMLPQLHTEPRLLVSAVPQQR